MEKEFDYRKAADFLKAIAHPTRLKMVKLLYNKKECVKNVEEWLQKRQANVSQHLNILRSQGIVDYIPEGKSRCYYLKNPDLIKKILECLKKITV